MTSAYDKEEKAVLKAKLKDLGYAVSPNASLDTLKEKYEQACSENNKSGKPDSDSVKSIAELREELNKDAHKLIRVKISNVNPQKQGLHGEIYTVCNNIIGKISRYIPWDDAGEAYHVENALLKLLQGKQFLQVNSRRDPDTGEVTVEHRYAPEFIIEILPPLTQDELNDLAIRQTARDSFGK